MAENKIEYMIEYFLCDYFYIVPNLNKDAILHFKLKNSNSFSYLFELTDTFKYDKNTEKYTCKLEFNKFDAIFLNVTYEHIYRNNVLVLASYGRGTDSVKLEYIYHHSAIEAKNDSSQDDILNPEIPPILL